jgi:hypothetical protein
LRREKEGWRFFRKIIELFRKSSSNFVHYRAEKFPNIQGIVPLPSSLSYFIGLVYVKHVRIIVRSFLIFSNSSYLFLGQPAHAYNYSFQQYHQCIGLYIQSNTSSCLWDSTWPNVSPFICELCRFCMYLLIIFSVFSFYRLQTISFDHFTVGIKNFA